MDVMGKKALRAQNLFAVDICKTPPRWWRMVGRKSVKGLTKLVDGAKAWKLYMSEN